VKIAFFYHSLISDWNHGNAHFLRGITSELIAQGHEVRVFEPWNSWSRENLLREQGEKALINFHRAYPMLNGYIYDPLTIDLSEWLEGVDLALVHEWNDPSLIKRIGNFRKESKSLTLFFHDTHHRCITDEQSISHYDLSGYDAVLAYGEVIRQRYLSKGWIDCAWTWHEAADIRVFKPLDKKKKGDLVWIGNWGDDERTAELQEFLLDPIRDLNLTASVYGVRYPEHAISSLAAAGAHYGGWLPNYEVANTFAEYRLTLHIPRRPYVEALPGIPTIRPFEALACGIPMICSPWDDIEELFEPGKDYLIAQNGTEMKKRIKDVLNDDQLSKSLIEHGLKTIHSKHTCAHRVRELMQIYSEFVPAVEQAVIV
jgi:spore maturation protein CgeB